ncbi:MAG: response regulator [Lachnospiraceae bacterium]|nr:response regulator [Lachnospiraceae bacterium]
MESRILMISERKSMIVNALVEGLQKEGFQLVVSPTDLRKLPGIQNPPQILLFYLQDSDPDTDMTTRMRILQEYIAGRVENREQIALYLLGTAEELAEAKSLLPPDYIKGMFIRPFRADDVARTIREGIDNDAFVKVKKRVLVVDDDATMLRTMKEGLSKNYQVYTANSGMNAIQLLIKTQVDLILLDYEMPVVKGPQVLNMIRSDANMKDTPVMFLTAKSDRHTISEILSTKPEGYLLKSLPQSAILQAIANFFAEK